MPTIAILPVKGFDQAKQRLAHELSPGPRQALVEAMFSDVLVALRRARRVDRVLVVTGDRGAQQIAAGYGAGVVDDLQEGHNAAARRGITDAVQEGADRVLLVPGDCPLLDPGEVDALIERSAGPRSALIVPDRHGTGTNALMLAPPDPLMPTFGPGSCERHAASAAARSTPHEVIHLPSLALDVDTPEDLAALAEELRRMHGSAAHTRGMLNQLDRSRGR